jgi:hypothetical protein
MDKANAMEVDYNLGLNNDNAGVSFELDPQKDMTDEDVMHHLDVIENIELDPETFGIQSEKDTESSTQEKEQNEDEMDVPIVDEPIEEKWYEKKVIS